MDESASGPVIIETRRLVLRTLEPADADALARLYADPEVLRYFAGGPRDRDYAVRNIAFLARQHEEIGYSLWATIHKPDSRFIGRCGLLPQVVDGSAETEVGYMIAREYWGRGLGTEAARAIRDHGFRLLPCDRLISLIHSENVASQRVAEKNGMCYERDTTLKEVSCRLYSITRPEWLRITSR